jgi:hypothetical protein
MTGSLGAALLLAIACDVHIDVEDPEDDGGADEGGEDEGGEDEGGADEGGGEEGGADEGGGEEGGADEGGGEEGGADEGGGEEGGEDESSGGEEGGADESTGGSGEGCDLFAQDCAVGEKCVGWSNDGGPTHNATRCAPIDSQPGQAGDLCLVEGSETSGIDTCDIALQCLYTDPKTNTGHCVPLCMGSAAEPVCVDPSTSCQFYNGMVLTACLED